MDIKAYLQRIDYRGSLSISAETLRDLQLAHLRAVPFENLSIHAHEAIVLDDEALFNKIVIRRRGGFCYELNGLFAALLRALGFEVQLLSAAVAVDQGDFGPDFDHMTLMVKLGERWLADVGFGDSFLEPLRLDYDDEQVQGARGYKIVPNRSDLILMQRESNTDWKAQYRFSLEPHEYADYALMCHYHQTSPQSHFTKARVCSRATSEGRITLSEMKLITTRTDGERQERLMANTTEYENALREHFGIVMTS